MFGFPSFTKLVLLVAIVVGVWYAFKLIGQFERTRKQAAKLQAKARTRSGRPAAPADVVEDMVKCRACGAYVAKRGASRCDRADCPI